MENFIAWFERNRKTIGYTVGGFNLFVGLTNLLVGSGILAIFWLAVGSAIIFDAKHFK